MRISDWSSDVCSSDLQIALDLHLVGVLLVTDQLIGVEDMARDTVEVAEIFALDLAKAEDVGDGHGAEIEIGAVGHAQRSRAVVIVEVAAIDAVGSECLLSVHKWLEGRDARRDDHLRGAAVLAERQIEIVEDGEILQPVGWLDQQRGAEAVVVLVLEIAAARSEEHTSELQSLMRISYAVFCL